MKHQFVALSCIWGALNIFGVASASTQDKSVKFAIDGFKKVVAAFSGHNHSNYTREINRITYVQINSASYAWIDKPSMTERRYSAEVNSKFPILKYSITYDRPLYGVVTLWERGLKMKGKKGQFVSPTPNELKMPDFLGVFPLVSEIKDYCVIFDKL